MTMAAMSSRPSLLVLSCLYCFSILSIHVQPAGSLSFNLSFSQPQSPNLPQLIRRTGDAYFSPDTLELTRNTRDQSSTYSTGRAKYFLPVPLWDAATGEIASFTTTFSFKITLDPGVWPGDGMAFFLGHFESDIPEKSGGGSLGLLPVNTNGTGNGTIVAVEFDTYPNQQYGDISSSHVAIDVNSLNSTASTDTTSATTNLTSGYPMVATVRYENTTNLLDVDLKINGTSYNVNATVDLRKYLPENVAVGFAAATGASGELHQILSWSFASTLEAKIQPISPAPPPQAPDITTSTFRHRPKRVGTLIAVLVPLSLLACAAVGFLVWQKKHKRRSKRPDGTSDSDNEEQDDRSELKRGVAASGPRRYTYGELAAATGNFAEEEKLGRGGFGSVYRGKLAVSGEERPVAIKMFSSESSAQGRKEFEAEVRIISRLKHRNLVQLLGWCDSRKGLLLVYELVAEGSLDRHLGSSTSSVLTWPERYQIILGLGSALRYLHHEWEQCVVHGDIKPSNIMLDESLRAKLGDFGLARLGEHGARWHTTKAVLGTAGYIDPEFVNTRHPSTHSDVYSFGIALLEIVSGRSPVTIPQDGGPPFILLKWVWGLYGRDAILDAAEERLRGGDDKRMQRVLVVGLWCAHPDQSERPSIAEAMQVLQSEDARLPALTPQMYNYKTASDFAITGRAYGALSIESYSSESSTTTGDSKLSSVSSTTALLRHSKERA